MKHFENEFTRIYNGDTIEQMDMLISEGVKVNKIITSPPYNIIQPNRSDRGYDVYQDGMTNDEYIEWNINIFERYNKILEKDGCVIYNMSYGGENTEVMNLTVASIIRNTNFTLADVLVWKKKNAQPNWVQSNRMTRICEFVYVFCRRGEENTFTSNKSIIGTTEKTGQPIYENMFNYFCTKNNDESNDLNKATFSTDFVTNLIDRYVRKTDVVLDNFSGTGTTSVACEMKNIKSIGIELSEAQCEYTSKRIALGIQQSFM